MIAHGIPGTTWQRFPNHPAALCLCGALLATQNDEWSVANHRYRSETAMHKLVIQAEEEVLAQLEQWTA